MFTQTRPGPPPAAGVALAVSAFAVAAVVGAVAGDDGLCDVFGLKKSASVFFAGDGETAGLAPAAASAFLRVRFALGEAAGDGDSAGLATVAASVFLRPRFGLGEAAGDSATAGDAAFSVGETVAAAFLCVRCFAGDGDAAGEGD